MKTIIKPSRGKVIFYIITLSIVAVVFAFMLSIDWNTQRDYKFALILYAVICGGYIYLIHRLISSKNKIIFEFDDIGITVYGRSKTQKIFLWNEISKVDYFIYRFSYSIYLTILEQNNNNATYQMKIDISSVMNYRATFKLVQSAFNQHSKYGRAGADVRNYST